MFREADYEHLMIADSQEDLIEKVRNFFCDQYGEDQVKIAQENIANEPTTHPENEIYYWEQIHWCFDDGVIMEIYYPDQIS